MATSKASPKAPVQKEPETPTHEGFNQLVEKLKPHAVTIGVLAAAIVIGAILIGMRLSQGAPLATGNWTTLRGILTEAHPADELEAFATNPENRSSDAAGWAFIYLGDIYLANASRELFQDRSAADRDLAKAREAYEEAEKISGPNAKLNLFRKARARFGLAQTFEAMCNPDDAVRYYKMVAEDTTDPGIAKVAADSLKRVSDRGNQEFLVWFGAQKPTPRSNSGLLGNRPAGETDFSLPDLPNVNAKSKDNFDPLGSRKKLGDEGDFKSSIPDFKSKGDTEPRGKTPQGGEFKSNRAGSNSESDAENSESSPSAEGEGEASPDTDSK